MKDMMIGVDLAKNVFQVHGALRTGEVQFRKKLTRKQFPGFMAQQEPCMVIFEACGSADVNALRALLYEHGHVFSIGTRHLDRMTALAKDEPSDLPVLIREECQDLLAQIAEKTARIAERTAKLKALAARADRARRLQTMPGVGPLTAVAVEAFGPDMAQFKTGRDFAAWLGLVPRQHSSGGKERLGRMTKVGQADIRRLLIVGAMSRLGWLGQRTISEGSWLSRMLARKPRMLVAIALANKMARQIWAMLTKNEDHKYPALAGAA